MKNHKITRRQFLKLSGVTLAGATVAASTPTTPDNKKQEIQSTSTTSPDVGKSVNENPVSNYKEAPMLASMVGAGNLPYIDERLPNNPMVIQPIESTGKYGGTMNLLTMDSGGLGNIRMKFYDPPIRWKADLTGYEPGLASSYEWSNDGRVVTFNFRQELKWSDGEPFTTADLKFWWDDLVNNEEYSQLYMSPWYFNNKDGNRIVDVSFPDDYTMVWSSSSDPLYIAPYVLAQGFWEWEPLMKPMHYLKQFHSKYNADAKPEEIESNDKWWQNPDYPVLMGWHCSKVAEDGTSITFERNPYYWKVDTEGNQLPYIDTVVVDIVKDPQVALLQTSQGKYDVVFRGADASPNDIPFLTEQASAGGYHLLQNWKQGTGSWPAYLINQDYVAGGKNYQEDTPETAAEIRALLRDKNFRRGLAYAIDRDRMIDVVWGGIGSPVGSTISQQSWHFASAEGQKKFLEWQQAYAGFDSAKAAEFFVAAGMTKGDDGFYTLPSGKTFTLVVDVTNWPGIKISEDSGSELEKQFEAAGINTQLNNVIGQPDSDARGTSGYFMLRTYEASELDLWTYPDEVFPVRNNRSFPLQGHWRETAGKEGEKPEIGSPAERLQTLYDKGLNEADEQKRHEIVWEAVDIHIEEGPFALGISGEQSVPVIVKDNFHNVLDFGVTGPWAPGTPGNHHSAQWWKDS